MIGVNRVGNDQELEYGGRSMIISPTGEILADASDETVVMHSMIQETKVRNGEKHFLPFRNFWTKN